jgi:hypothetical protein
MEYFKKFSGPTYRRIKIMTYIHKLNSIGIEHFKNYLYNLKGRPDLEPPFEILKDSNFSNQLSTEVKLEEIKFHNRTHMVEYLFQTLKNASISPGTEDQGLWSWLSLYYFDQVCPKKIDGNRFPGAYQRHILEAGFRRYYKHLLAGPFESYRIYKEKARLLLYGPVHQANDVQARLAERQSFITNPGIIEVVDLLYFDSDINKPKPGTQSKTRGGSLYRFITVIQQLDLTYDLYSMNAYDILSLLPEEFNKWKNFELT